MRDVQREMRTHREDHNDCMEELLHKWNLGRFLLVLLESPKLSYVGTRMLNHCLEKIRKSVRPEYILEKCDRNGITHSGYGAIYKSLKGAVKSLGKGFGVGCLPNPYQMSKVGQKINSKLEDMIGEHYHIENTLVIPSPAKSKSKDRACENCLIRSNFLLC